MRYGEGEEVRVTSSEASEGSKMSSEVSISFAQI